MASRKSTKLSVPWPPKMHDATGMLAKLAGGILVQPESHLFSTDLVLSPEDRAFVASLPGLPPTVADQLATRSTSATSINLTLADLALVCNALSNALHEAKDMEILNQLVLMGQVTDRLDRGIKEMAKRRRSRNSADTARAAHAAGGVYQLKITLKHISPPIWRRIQIVDCSLADLHEAIQEAMGWENYHLYAFSVSGERYAGPGGAGEMGMADASRAKLSRLISRAKTKFRYTYDFGDNWEHEVLVEKILPLDQETPYPVVLDGKRACPPEDVGGPWGYSEYLEAIRDPNHERHEEMLEWGGEFDPEAMDS